MHYPDWQNNSCVIKDVCLCHCIPGIHIVHQTKSSTLLHTHTQRKKKKINRTIEMENENKIIKKKNLNEEKKTC